MKLSIYAWLALSAMLMSKAAFGQAARIITPPPLTIRDSITILFDATQGDRGMQDFNGPVYVHTGLITSQSSSNRDWRNVVAGFNVADPRLLTRRVAPNLYQFRFRIDSLYRVDSTVSILNLAFLLRSSDGRRVGRGNNGQDIILPFRTTPPKAFANASLINNQLRVRLSDSSLYVIEPYLNGIARVAHYPRAVAPNPKPSFAVAASQATTAMQVTGLEVTAPFILTQMNGIKVMVRKSPLEIIYLNELNDTLTKEIPSDLSTATTQNAQFKIGTDDAILGLGFRALPTNRRGRRIELYNQAHYGYSNNRPNLNISIPLVLTDKGYGIFFDEERYGTMDLAAENASIINYNTASDRVNYFVIAGTTLSKQLERYTALTGRQPLPPKWSLGYIQSRYGYRTEAETRTMVNGMRNAGFPMSAVILDLFWFGGMNRMGDLDWDRLNFPTPENMMATFKRQGIQTILITEPYFTQRSRTFNDLSQRGLLAKNANNQDFIIGNFWAGSAGLIDFSDTTALNWMWPFYRARAREGVGSWWSDLCEPETHPDDMVHRGGSARVVHNILNQNWLKMLYERYNQEFPNQRLINLSRSGYAGMQRFRAVPWSGDIQRSWAGLQSQIPIMLGMGLSGVAYMHSDAGGFTGGPQDNELYTRWMQFASFTPMLRPHGEGVPPEPINYPEPFRGIVRNFAQLRHRLLPYNYTLAYENSSKGIPLARPMAMLDTALSQNWQADDNQYLWGNDILIAPILEAGLANRSVQIPSSAGPWIDFWTGSQYNAGTVVNVNAALQRMPILVRAGSIIPMLPYRTSTHQSKFDSLELHYYPAQGLSGNAAQVFDDIDSTTSTLQNNAFHLMEFQDIATDQSSITLRASLKAGNGYVGAPIKRHIEYTIHRYGAYPGGIYIDGNLVPLMNSLAAYRTAPDSAAFYDTQTRRLRVKFKWNVAQTKVLNISEILVSANEEIEGKSIELFAPFPNPFGAKTTLNYYIHEPSSFKMNLFTAQGALVRSWEISAHEPTAGSIIWDGADGSGKPLPAGVYLFQAGSQVFRVVKQ